MSTRSVVALIVCILVSPLAFAQAIPQNPNQVSAGVREGKWTVLFDKDWKEIPDKSKAVYYRVIEYKKGKPAGTARDYFADGRLQWEGQLVSENPDVNTGVCTWYYEDGTKQRESTYLNGKREGKEVLYYQGKKYAEGTYTDENKNLDWVYYANDFNSLQSTATQYYYLKNYAKAEEVYNKAAALATKDFGVASVQYRDTRWWMYYTYDEAGKVTEAVNALKDAIRTSSLLIDEYEIKVIEDAERYANKLKDGEKYNEAAVLYRVCARARERRGWFEYPAYYTDLKRVMDYNYSQGKLDSMHYYFKKIAAVIPDNERQLGTHLYDWASYTIAQKQTDRFAEIEKACEAYLKAKEQKNEKDAGYAEGWVAFGKIQDARGQYERALKCFSDARASLKAEDNQKLYLRTLYLSASAYNKTKKYEAGAKAVFDEFESWNDRFQEYLGTEYIDNMTEVVRYASAIKDYAHAEKALLKMLPVTEKEFGKGSSEYKMLQITLSGMYEAQGKNDMAKATKPTLSQSDQNDIAESLGLKQASADLTLLQKALSGGRLNEALTIFQRSYNLFKNFYESKGDYDGLVSISSVVASCYQQTGDLYNAGQLLLSTKKIADEHLEKSSETYINMLLSLGDYYSGIGSAKEADDTWYGGMQILDKAKTTKNSKQNDEQYYILAARLAGLFAQQRQFTDAENLYFDILAYYEKTDGKNSYRYHFTSTALADVYQRMRRFAIASSMYEDAMPVFKKELGEQSPAYIDASRTLANIYLLQGDYVSGEQPYLKAKTFYQSALGTKSEKYLGILSDLGLLYTYSGQLNKAAPIYHEQIALHLEQVKNLFPLLNEKEKTDFYALSRSQFNTYNVFAMQQLKSNPAEAGDMYNLQLVSKSLLFKATNRVRTSVMNSKDENLKALYRRWQDSREQLSKVYQLSSESKKSAGIDEKQLEKQINDLERELTVKSELFARLISDNPDWKTIKAALKPGEAAVEIVRIIEALPQFTFDYLGKGISYDTLDAEGYARVGNLFAKCSALTAGLRVGETILAINDKSTKGKSMDDIGAMLEPKTVKLTLRKKNSKTTYTAQVSTDSVFYRSYPKKIRYVALVVTPDAQAPRYVTIANGDELETRYARFYRNAIQTKVEDPYSYKFFWQPLKSILGSATRVYFSPDGVYHTINPATLYNTDTKRFVLDDTEVVLVSNTADILRPGGISTSKRAVLVGFPDYNNIGASTAKKKPSEYMFLKKDSAQRFMAGNTVAELPGTRVEVNTIEGLLKPKMDVAKYVSADASEEKIKSMDAPRLLHIATHGFFLDDISGDDEGERSVTGISNSTLAENPLLRSGLLLAGAGNTITEGRRDNQSEDGVLTAYEALNLNLNDTDLVVLSACETGLGKIQSGEGVYGLQRAFRAAGAQSVLMSLWKVDDQATQQLMTGFYGEWVNKGQKQNAFREAQLRLRKEYPHPYYWGAFVMMGQ
ncbi:MAG TPA: CHAT domain-containing protein [Cyclobacteriaceae bacterium]|nr:CHAT domain-containing protein [Cyclobacteriaceae bacterium]